MNNKNKLKESTIKEINLGKKYAGRIPSKLGEEMIQYIQKSRAEWAERTSFNY
jgi:hypothetical protein